jgi:hypothetical protein
MMSVLVQHEREQGLEQRSGGGLSAAFDKGV